MRAITCRACGSRDVNEYTLGVLEAIDGQWEPTGENAPRRWVNCQDCGHSWRTERSHYDLLANSERRADRAHAREDDR